jgi:hypothetical protein
MRIQVEPLGGKLDDVSPARFRLGECLIEVVDVVDRWHGESTEHFRVLGSDGHMYVLKRQGGSDDRYAWEMVSFTHKDSQGMGPTPREGIRVLH